MRGLNLGGFERWLPLLVMVVGAACASTPPQSTGTGNAASATEPGAAALVDPAIEPTLVVEAHDPAPESAVTCREMLRPGSNVIVRQCMTLADWKRFDRRQAFEAQQIVRRLQGSAYR